MTPANPATLDSADQAFYNWLLAVCAYIQRVYGITVFPLLQNVAGPGSPVADNQFYVASPIYGAPVYVENLYQGIFGTNYAGAAAILLGQLAWPNAAPQPLAAAPAVPVTPPPPSNPIGASFVDGGETDYVDLGSPNIQVGGKYTDPAGNVYTKQGDRTPFGWEYWWTLTTKAANVAGAVAPLLLAICALFLCAPAKAQVQVKFTPESSAVPTAAVATARNIQRYEADFCNVGTAPVVLTQQQLSLAAPTIPFIDATDSALVLNGDVQRTFWAKLEHYASLGSQVAALLLAVKGGNSAWATGLAVGGSVLPGVITIAQGQTPSAAPLLVQLQYPLTLGPGSCGTDHFFASRTGKGKGSVGAPVMVTIPGH